MTRDELIERVRKSLAGTRGITEKRMFGGVAFFLHGNMVAGTASGDLLLRVGKEGEAAALKEAHTRPMVMAGRRMGGYIYVEAAALTKAAALASWLRRALEHVGTLPKKKTKAASTRAKPKTTRR